MSYTPTTQQVEDGFAHEPEYEYHNPVDYGSHVQSNRRAFKRWLAALIREAKAEAWDVGVATALNYAKRQPDGITLRLETFEGDPWPNPYREGSET